ncbi:MAG: diacylglycerol kinase family protein [Tepidisphaeraceae bacterium]
MSPFKTVAILANPLAGQGKGKETAQCLERSLQTAGIRAPTIFDTPAASVGEASAEDAEILAAADAIIAIGGDGTLRAVASRCLKVRGDIPPLLPIPMGTANLMGRYLGIHWEAGDLPQRVVQSLQAARVVMLDAAQANGQLFLVMAGIGIDAQIIHEMDRIRDGPIKYASYVIPAALAVANYRYVPLEVVVDGKKIFPSAPAMAFVANISEYGTGFPVAPDARPDDGLLDVCIVPVVSLVDAVRQFFHAAAGEHVLAEGVVYARGKQIEVYSPQPVPVQIDGDSAGYTPTRIGLLRVRVPFIVPV